MEKLEVKVDFKFTMWYYVALVIFFFKGDITLPKFLRNKKLATIAVGDKKQGFTFQELLNNDN